jgi:hypothetical protein
MNNYVFKAKMVAELFGMGVKTEMENSGSLGFAGLVGLYQGLKYNGSLIRGLKAGAATFGVFAAISGVRSVTDNWSIIKNMSIKES